MYEGYVSLAYNDYLKKLSKYCAIVYFDDILFTKIFIKIFLMICLFSGSWTRSGEWGDHVTLQAAADWVWETITLFCLSFTLVILKKI